MSSCEELEKGVAASNGTVGKELTMAWNAAVVFSYGVPVSGREAAALENFANAQTFFGKLAVEDKCAEPEIFHHGFGGGMMIVKAETPAILQEILTMDEGQKLLAAASFTSTDFRYELYLTGEELAESMVRYAGVGAELGYV